MDNFAFRSFGILQKQTAQQVREMLIRFFLDAHNKTCTPLNIIMGFRKSGIYQFDPINCILFLFRIFFKKLIN